MLVEVRGPCGGYRFPAESSGDREHFRRNFPRKRVGPPRGECMVARASRTREVAQEGAPPGMLETRRSARWAKRRALQPTKTAWRSTGRSSIEDSAPPSTDRRRDQRWGGARTLGEVGAAHSANKRRVMAAQAGGLLRKNGKTLLYYARADVLQQDAPDQHVSRRGLGRVPQPVHGDQFSPDNLALITDKLETIVSPMGSRGPPSAKIVAAGPDLRNRSSPFWGG